MRYTVHGKPILWDDKKEIGFCTKLEEGPVNARYFVSNIEVIIKVANESEEEALKGAKLMHERVSKQLEHSSLKYLPRFKEGIKGSKEIYNKLIKTLEKKELKLINLP